MSGSTRYNDINLLVTRANQRYANIRSKITEFCVQNNQGTVHALFINNDENAPLHARHRSISENEHSAYLRIMCVSTRDSQSTLHFVVDIARESEVIGSLVKYSLNLQSMEPAPGLAKKYLANWSQDESLNDAEILY